MPWHTHDQHASLTNPEAINIPKTYISCPNTIIFIYGSESKISRLGLSELKTGHDAMITAPKELAS
ncbi:MAG: hypothetical protein P0116_11370 [Candidatus Nitrosocosmicus sp.]|nr:hypothetical protein [Candidatus Nitrosocosmicus sp.]